MTQPRTELAGAPETRPAAAPAAGSGNPSYAFGSLRLDADGTLRRGQDVIHLPPRELAALRLLLARAGQIVTPPQLQQALWGDLHVTPDSLPKCISSLRARLEPEDFIQTVYKRGYRFSAQVSHPQAAPSGTLPRLAIPPFATGYGIPAHLGAAIAEETSSRLCNARDAQVSVLARDSVFNLADRGLTAQQLGETLKADLVLCGTLSALARHFRLRVEMIRIADGTQVWVEDMLVDQSRVAGVEWELAGRLASRLSTGAASDSATATEWNPGAPFAPLRLTAAPLFAGLGGLSLAAAAEPEANPKRREAYEAFLRGRQEWQTLERHRMRDGLQHLSRAAELDPSLIAAKIDLARLCVTQSFYGFMSPAMAADLVLRTADSIPNLPGQAEAILPALGWVNFHFDRNLPAALWAFSFSAHLPHDPWTTRVRVMFALSRHRFGEAIELLESAIQIDPYSPWLHNRLAWALHLDGQAAESIRCIEHAAALFPEHEGTALYGSMILACNGEPERGEQLARDLIRRIPYFDLATAACAYALACAGRSEEAQAILERLRWMSRERFVLSSFTPAVHVALGDLDAAIEDLQAANQARCPWFFQMLADPRLKPLHGRPDFERMEEILPRMEAEATRSMELEA